jgi:hypothetical protein
LSELSKASSLLRET